MVEGWRERSEERREVVEGGRAMYSGETGERSCRMVWIRMEGRGQRKPWRR